MIEEEDTLVVDSPAVGIPAGVDNLVVDRLVEAVDRHHHYHIVDLESMTSGE